MKKFSETTKIKICFVAAASDGQQQCSDKIISGETYCLNIKSRQTKPHIYNTSHEFEYGWGAAELSVLIYPTMSSEIINDNKKKARFSMPTGLPEFTLLTSVWGHAIYI